MNYTEQEFNELAAKSESLDYEIYKGKVYEKVSRFKRMPVEPYSDLNQLMPSAWKHKINVYVYAEKWVASEMDVESGENTHNEAINKDPVQAIRDCLFSIWSDNNG